MGGLDLPPYTMGDPRWQAAVREAEGRCIVCSPAQHPLGHPLPPERQHEGHVGIRLGDVGGPTWLITLDGQDCTDHTIEADAANGWVIATIPNPEQAGPSILVHLDHPITAVLEGRVEVTKAPLGARIIRPNPSTRTDPRRR